MMGRKLTRTILASLTVPAILHLAACASGLAQPQAGDALRAAERWPGVTLEQLAEGRSLYVARCAGCHNLHLPERYTPEKWLDLVPAMAVKARLSPGEVETIERYLYATSARVRDEK
jgi:hypothetical protein